MENIKEKTRLGERFRAAGSHLIFSCALLLLAFYLIRVLWYPYPLAEATGVSHLYQVMLVTTITLGPLLTFITFKQDELKFRFDLAIILTLQLGAYFYGMTVVAQSRPAWISFVVDDFELVRVADIDLRQSQYFKPEYRKKLFSKPNFVASNYSENLETRNRQREDEMFNGISLAQRPETYAPIETRYLDVLKRSKPIHELEQYNSHDDIKRLTKAHPNAMRWLPLKAPKKDMAIIVDTNGTIITIANLSPWQ